LLFSSCFFATKNNLIFQIDFERQMDEFSINLLTHQKQIYFSSQKKIKRSSVRPIGGATTFTIATLSIETYSIMKNATVRAKLGMTAALRHSA
jgi:hypothetical protein